MTMGASDDTLKIAEFSGVDEIRASIVRGALFSSCDHLHVQLDDEKHLIECKSCGALVDAYNWVSQIVKRRQWKWQSIQGLQRELDKAQERLSEVLKQERNVKARLRRLNKKATQ